MTISPYLHHHHHHLSGNPPMFADATVEYRSFVEQNGEPIDNQHYVIHEHHSPDENYVEAVDLTANDSTEGELHGEYYGDEDDGLELSTTSTNSSTSCSSSSESEQDQTEELEYPLMTGESEEEQEEEEEEGRIQLNGGEEEHRKEIVDLLERRLAEEEAQLEELQEEEEEENEEDENEPGTPNARVIWTDDNELHNIVEQYESALESSSRQAGAARGGFQSPLLYSHRLQPNTTSSRHLNIHNLPTYRSLSPEQQQLTDEVLDEINQLEKEYEELLEANSSLQI